MKIVVFGASRGVGLQVVKQALEMGHSMTAFVRSPEKFSVTHTNLTIFKGDSMDAVAVAEAIAGQDAVVSTLAPTRPPVPNLMETSAKNIVAGMQKHGVRRLVSTTGAGIRQPEDEPKFVDRLVVFLLNLLAKDVALDSAENARVIQAADLDWTIARFPRLMDGEHTRTYRVGYVSKESSTQLSRADAADFVLRELVEKKWLRRLPSVSY
jgi:putative NADH-flavin reductase